MGVEDALPLAPVVIRSTWSTYEKKGRTGDGYRQKSWRDRDGRSKENSLRQLRRVGHWSFLRRVWRATNRKL
jgi:hypothetical protein